MQHSLTEKLLKATIIEVFIKSNLILYEQCSAITIQGNSVMFLSALLAGLSNNYKTD